MTVRRPSPERPSPEPWSNPAPNPGFDPASTTGSGATAAGREPAARPLEQRLVAITRAEEQLGQARALFEQAGARVLDLPALVIGPPDHWGPLDDALADLESFHWLIFSSSNGVDAVDARLRRQGSSLARRPAGLRLAAVGRRTAERLETIGAAADFVPPAFVADSLIEHFPVSGWGLRLLLPRVQSGGRGVLAEAFGAAGARVVEVAAYESRCPDAIPAPTLVALESGAVEAITFSSGKTVRHTAELLERAWGAGWLQRLTEVALVSIGPQTSRSCRELLGRVDAEAAPHDLGGLVAATAQALRRGSGAGADRPGPG